VKQFLSLIAAMFAVLALALSLPATAAEAPFTQAAFDHAIATGKPVVVDFSAYWCPVCKAQRPVISAILQEPEMAGVTVLVADFDRESRIKQALRVRVQSTQVVFKGGREVARATGQTQKTALKALLSHAL
jgi:thioredoxin 1